MRPIIFADTKCKTYAEYCNLLNYILEFLMIYFLTFSFIIDTDTDSLDHYIWKWSHSLILTLVSNRSMFTKPTRIYNLPLNFHSTFCTSSISIGKALWCWPPTNSSDIFDTDNVLVHLTEDYHIDFAKQWIFPYIITWNQHISDWNALHKKCTLSYGKRPCFLDMHI